jgi:ABC-type bacteriocin/lantibiotic exporter with double-glycine peptidase domain
VVPIRKSSEDRLLIKWQLDNPQKIKNIATYIRYYDESVSFDRSHFQELTGWPFEHFLADIDKLRDMDFYLLAKKQHKNVSVVKPSNSWSQKDLVVSHEQLKKKWSGCESTLSQVFKKLDMGEKPNAAIFKYNTGHSLEDFYTDINFLKDFVTEYVRKHY